MSEPPEIRRQIEQQARAELIKAGADEKATSVTVLSAYKQGYSWLYDVVRPALEGKGVDQITIRFAELGPPSGWTQQGMYAPTRWLLEIYPIDEILASELKIDLKNIHFEMAPIGSPAYEVIATAKDGASAVPSNLRSGLRRAAVLRPLSGLRTRARDDRMAQGRPSAASRRRTNASRPIRSASGIASSRRPCPRCTTT